MCQWRDTATAIVKSLCGLGMPAQVQEAVLILQGRKKQIPEGIVVLVCFGTKDQIILHHSPCTLFQPLHQFSSVAAPASSAAGTSACARSVFSTELLSCGSASGKENE